MATHALRHQVTTTELPRWLVAGFVCGFFSVLVFHQGALGLLHALQLTPATPYPMDPTSPFGIPKLLSLAVWGGLWGALLAATLAPLDGAPLVAAATIFGAVFPTVIAWFAVAPAKGEPMAAGFVPAAMLTAPIVNAAWGLGTGLGLLLLARRRAARAPT